MKGASTKAIICYISLSFEQSDQMMKYGTCGCTLLIQFPIPTRVKWVVGKSLISSLSHIQSLQFNFYFADESQVFEMILKKLVRVQLVFLII